MPFGVRTPVGPRKNVLDRGAHWRNLANTTEPSMCGGPLQPFCQITVTTCFTYVTFYVFYSTPVRVLSIVMSVSVCLHVSSSLHIKRGKVSVRTSVTVGVASSAANDVTLRMTSQCERRHNDNSWLTERSGDWRHVATGCTALVYLKEDTSEPHEIFCTCCVHG